MLRVVAEDERSGGFLSGVLAAGELTVLAVC